MPVKGTGRSNLTPGAMRNGSNPDSNQRSREALSINRECLRKGHAQTLIMRERGIGFAFDPKKGTDAVAIRGRFPTSHGT